MIFQGTQQLNTLKAIADIQNAASINEVEDVQLAEKIGVDIGMVRNSLTALEKAKYVNLEKVRTLIGTGCTASLTPRGKAVVKTFT